MEPDCGDMENAAQLDFTTFSNRLSVDEDDDKEEAHDLSISSSFMVAGPSENAFQFT